MDNIQFRRKPNALIRAIFFIYMLITILEKLRWDIGGWSADICIISTPIVLILLCALYITNDKRIRITIIDKRFLLYYVLMFLYVLFQFMIIDYTQSMMIQHIKGVVTVGVELVMFFNFMLMVNYDDYSIDFEYVSKCFYMLTLINVLYCMMQNVNPEIDTQFVSMFHSSVGRYGTDSYGQMERPTGLFIDSNFNGSFLVMGLINEIYRLSYVKKKQSKKIFTYAMIIITLFEIFMTLSLTSYIGLVFYGLYMFWKSNINKKMVWVLAGIILSVVLVYFYMSSSGLQVALNAKFSLFESMDALKSNSHYIIAVQTLEIFTLNIRNILFGTGYNCLNVFFQDIFLYTSMKAHNYYLQRLVELGLVGFLFIAYYIKLLFSQTKKTGFQAALQKVMILTMLSMNFTYDAFTRNFNIVFVIFTMLLYKNRYHFE